MTQLFILPEFEARFGNELDLLRETLEMIQEAA